MTRLAQSRVVAGTSRDRVQAWSASGISIAGFICRKAWNAASNRFVRRRISGLLAFLSKATMCHSKRSAAMPS